MKLFKYKVGRYPFGIWTAIIALLLTMLAWVMQAYSLINWESAVEFGLQNGSFQGDDISQIMAAKEKGEAIADLIWVLPLNLLALVGILRKRFIGFVAAMMTFAVCIYFPLFYIFQIWNTFLMTAVGAVILWGIPSLFGIFGLWTNRKLFKP
ncbi:MAG: hypothetical protein HQ541_00260 [Mariniphaga sp.]|nr:hypothetical protein [Mariniphaga sp.]